MKAVFFVSKTVSKLLFDPPDERRELPLFSNVLLHAPPTRRVSRRIRTYCSTKRVSRERVENYLNFDPSTLLRVSFLLLTFNFLLLTYFWPSLLFNVFIIKKISMIDPILNFSSCTAPSPAESAGSPSPQRRRRGVLFSMAL